MMRSIGIFAVFALCAACSPVLANLVTFTPPGNPDLRDLDHYKYVRWGINWGIPADYQITEATLTIKDIDNSQEPESNDHLYIHLLDTATAGLKWYTDNQGGGDNFANKGPLVADYRDPGKGKETLVYKFSTLGLIDDLTGFLADGNFGLGFDPDCHYYNCGVTFQIETEKIPDTPVVPAPGAVILSCIGLALAAWRRRQLA